MAKVSEWRRVAADGTGCFQVEGCRKQLADVMDYDPVYDTWTKVGQLAKARSTHAMSLVPKETADYCGQTWNSNTF